ncbi:MAG TPA: 6-phosphogluconolactonase [Kofleriaceae bacterium]|nr:6-phosphogluconolactonase [Kofleriaceae bacterium]
MQVQRFKDLEAVSRAGAEELVQLARASNGPFHVALSGGSTPKRMHEILASMGREALPWERVVLWWGDERTVPPDHPDSNFGMAKRTLLDPLKLTRYFRMEGERDPAAAAADYEKRMLAEVGSPPALDLVFLGMGPDGHTASLFPGTQALGAHDRWVVSNPVDSPVAKGKTVRITVTLALLAAAKRVRFLVAGPDKTHILPRALGTPSPEIPSSLVRGPDVAWFVDEVAAEELPR